MLFSKIKGGNISLTSVPPYRACLAANLISLDYTLMPTQQTSSPDLLDLSQQAETAFKDQHYAQASVIYEKLITIEPAQVLHYWKLGLARLLLGEESEAQLTWMTVLSEASPDQAEEWVQSLIALLKLEAERLQSNLDEESKTNTQLAWTIRQHIREIVPSDLENLLHLLQLSIQLKLFEGKNLLDWEIISILESQSELKDLDLHWLLPVMEQTLEDWFEDPLVLQFAEVCLRRINNPQAIVELLFEKAQHLIELDTKRDSALATCYLEYCLRYEPDHDGILRFLLKLYVDADRLLESIDIARRIYEASEGLTAQLIEGGVLINRLARTGAHWAETQALHAQQQRLTQQFIAEYQPQEGVILDSGLVCAPFFNTPYFEDAPAKSRPIQNQVVKIYQEDLHFQGQEHVESFKRRCSMPRKKTDKIKIAYISSCLRQHSVGWLSRWLFHYHSHDRFEIYTYHIHNKHLPGGFADQWFVKNSDHSATFSGNPLGIAKHINETDEIDILVDLDSITHFCTFSTMAFKPAPVQVAWLGFDAPGLPAIDYFIADPYVLPDDAQHYYTEKLWRLPQTYVAVDGFEIGAPTLRREHLDIPDDAIIYLTAQQGHKLHPETIKTQFQILKEVPNSYLLIKGRADNLLLKKTFDQVAETEGVACDRLRFLPGAPSEYIHRANLQIADVILDTYPYNGATTTLETLWMGVPIVTKVGQQFAARNSYAFMTNAGITEGIAWTNEEYIEWGVRLGKDSNLREQIRSKLWRSRQTSPLWNAKQFTKEMENAYEQMWQQHLEGQ
jgi:predicted O-linked N-acetylglucosamine transferase (SPINDLY family)